MEKPMAACESQRLLSLGGAHLSLLTDSFSWETPNATKTLLTALC